MKNRKPVTHYQPRALDPRASCGRDLLGLSSTRDPSKTDCRLCATHPDVKRVKAAEAARATEESTDNA